MMGRNADHGRRHRASVLTLAALLTVGSATTTQEVDDYDEEQTTPNRSALLLQFRRLNPLHVWSKYGFFSEDFLDLVHSHWLLQTPPPSPMTQYLLAAVSSAIMVVGVSANSLVIYTFIRFRLLRTPANILALNLAVSDLLSLLSLVIVIYNSACMGPALGVKGCEVYGFVDGLSGAVSIATQTLIAMYRRRAVQQPLRRETSGRSTRRWLLATWLYGVIWSTPPLLGAEWAGRYVPEGYLTSCSVDYLNPGNRVFVLVSGAATWLLPLLLISSFYGAVIHSAISSDAASAQRRSRHNSRTEQRLTLVVAGVVSLLFLSWTSHVVMALLGVVGQQAYLSPLASLLPALLCKAVSCVNPFIYSSRQLPLCRCRDSEVLTTASLPFE